MIKAFRFAHTCAQNHYCVLRCGMPTNDFQIALEQYPTSPHLTAAVVLSALEREDIGPGCTVLDLGCGTAMLSLGWYAKKCINVFKFSI